MASWPRSIQHLAYALTQGDSLLEKPRLSLLITKNVMQAGGLQWLGLIETDDLYKNTIHFAIESVLSIYLVK